MSILGNRVLGGAGQQPYLVGRSLRFRASASATLTRTPSSAGNRKTWTWSGWVKRGIFGTDQWFLRANSTGTDFFLLGFSSANQFYSSFTAGVSAAGENYTTAVFRDPSAWYHCVCAFDSTQATASNRVKLYVNGVQQTLGVSNAPTLNADYQVNSTNLHYIGGFSGNYADFYLAEVNLIDGQALTPSSFGFYDNNGVWQPRKYGGTYGTNGFYLPFSNTTSTTTLVQDASGNGNNWTANNISLVTGTGRYLGSISGSIDLVNGGPPSSMFKGSTAQPGPYPQPGATLTWNPYASVPFTSTARVYIGVDVNGPANGLVVNSTNYGNGGIAGNAFGWVNVASAGSPITSISWSRASGGSQGMRVFAVEIDGVILADSPSWNPLYDSMTDSPTLSASSSNYVVWNAVFTENSVPNATMSNGNLKATAPTTSSVYSAGTIGTSTGKWYWENTIDGIPSTGSLFLGLTQTSPYASTYIRAYRHDTGEYFNGSAWSAYGATYTIGDIIGIALDLDNQTLTFYKNGVSQGQKTSIGLTGITVFPFAYLNYSTASVSSNFGQQPFTYTPPSGYKALNTYNLPQPTIMNGAKYMAATTYSGLASQQTISNNVNNAGFQPDLVWAKVRSNTYNHALLDVIRGQNYLSSNTTTGDTATGGVSLISNGVTWPGGASLFNDAGQTYVAWQWNAGSGVTSTNTNGSISSLVSVNPTAGFSIVSYTGNGTAGATVGHGLGVAPSMYIIKRRNAAEAWGVYHTSLGATKAINLELTAAAYTYSIAWNDTAPTSNVFSLGTWAAVNSNLGSFIAYCWSAVAGYSAFGSYTGNGSSDGPFIYTGHRPRWLLIKRTDTTANWQLFDTSRSLYNAAYNFLEPNTSNTEFNQPPYLDFLSNGFKLRGTGIGQTDADYNLSGGTYIYAAFAENPFKVSRAR